MCLPAVTKTTKASIKRISKTIAATKSAIKQFGDGNQQTLIAAKKEEYLEFLKSLPILAKLSEESILKLVECLEEIFYEYGDLIVRQGERSESIFIIYKGKVRVATATSESDNAVEKFEHNLYRGEYFGEEAVLEGMIAPANIYADDLDGVSCLVIRRENCLQFIKDLEDEEKKCREKIKSEFDTVTLQDLNRISTIGICGFGQVDLVNLTKDCSSASFALKKLCKKKIIATNQLEHIKSEKNIMSDCGSPFICSLYKTFQDQSYVYILMEWCEGGDLWSFLRNRGHFDDSAARFYTACIVEALRYLHERNITYRDLKPENIVIDRQGYVKLVDFGFAKKLGNGEKTWSFCGTPEYMPPEIVNHEGHDTSADCWSLGVLIFELLSGLSPFSASNPVLTYKYILKGIESIKFPRTVNRTAANLIKKLCRQEPTQRPRISQIQKHKWFEGFNWTELRNKTLKPPILPGKLINGNGFGYDANNNNNIFDGKLPPVEFDDEETASIPETILNNIEFDF